MQGPSVQSAGRRFLKKFSFSFVQALIFGGLLGMLVYVRAPESDADDELPLWAPLRRQLESWELATYDARARALGRRSQRSEQVVVVAMDDETLAASRQADHPGLATQPWPREVVGGLVSRMVDEGASLVLVDVPFTDLSPRVCPSPGSHAGKAEEEEGDDHAFRRLLDIHPGTSILGFGWQTLADPPPPSPIRPYLLYVATAPKRQALLARAQRLLADRRSAYLLPGKGGLELWAGVGDEEEAKRLAPRWGVSGTARIRELSASDRRFELGATELFLSLAAVEVEGIEPHRLTRARTLAHPVAVLLGEGSAYGGVQVEPDVDGVVRRLPHLVYFEDRENRGYVLPSMPLAAAMRKVGATRLRYDGERLHVGEALSLPMDAQGRSLLKWDAAEGDRTSAGSLKRAIPAWRVVVNLLDQVQGIPPRYPNALENRIAVLTRTSNRGGDFEPTPIGRSAGGAVLAQALVNVLGSDGLARASPEVDALLTFGLAFLGAFLALSFSAGVRSFTGAAFYASTVVMAGAGYVLLARSVFLEQRLWVAVVGPLMALGATFIATTLYVAKDERKVRDFLTTVLGKYVSPEVARQVTRNVALMKPERRWMTVYFSDLEGFTRLSDALPPERLVELLNAYLSEMTQVVRSTQGHIDKYIGDAVMAFWGAPARTEHHAQLACESALRMRERLLELQPRWEARYGQRLSFRAGLNTGEVVVGDMGSNLKSNYTVMGEAVNFAARLERDNRRYGTFILVGEETRRQACERYVFREVDKVRVQGTGTVKQVFELCGRMDGLTEARQQELRIYEMALAAYGQRAFAEALPLFERCATEFADPVAHVYVGRCRELLGSPPGPEWDGVFDVKVPVGSATC